MIRFVFALGNPGEKYRWTRHNMGFLVADRLALEFGCRWHCDRGFDWALIENGDSDVALVKPLTYMNRSGLAAADILEQRQGTVAESLAVYDDVALPFGRIRIRRKGSAGGHRGLLSLFRHCPGDWPRVRIGIAPPEPDWQAADDLSDYVLAPFTKQERNELAKTVEHAMNAVIDCWRNGLDHAMATYNRTDAAAGE